MQPAEGVRFIHAAICREVRSIEEQALSSEAPEELAALGTRVAWLDQVVHLHTDGEEDALYPELEKRARHVGAAYLHDHASERELFADLRRRIAAATTAPAATRAGEVAALRRGSIALTEHLVHHIRKEDTLITPLLVELFSPPEQGAHIGKMMARFAPEVLARALPWIVTNIDADDRVAYVSMMKGVVPPERFAAIAGWIRGGVPADVFTALAARVPGLG